MDSSSESNVVKAEGRKQYVAPTLTALGVTQGTRSGIQPRSYEYVSCTGHYYTSSGPA